MRSIVLAASLMFVATAGCSKASSNTPSNSVASEVKAIEVSTAIAQTQERPLAMQANGTFEASESSDVASPAEGIVTSTPLDIGASVKSGDVIVRLDDRDARLRFDQAKASVEQAEASLHQSESRIGLTSGSVFDPVKVPEVQAAQSSYESAKARARLAAADAARYAELVKSGDVSRSNYERYKTDADSAQAQAESARQQYEAALNSARQGFQGVGGSQATLASVKAQLAIAQKAVDDTVVKAPFAGQISARPVAVGEYVSKSTKLVTLVRTSPLKLQLQVPEANASRIKTGLRVVASVAAYSGQEFVGEVGAVNPSVSADSRTLTVEVRFQNPDLKLRPGMFATASVQLAGMEKAVFVTQDAVLRNAGLESTQVFVVAAGTAHGRVVQLGGLDGGGEGNGMVRVLSGLSGGETIATKNLDKLYDGVAVRQ